MSMFCYQCEQTVGGKGCTNVGVCGKQADIAALQDVMVHQLKGIGWLAHAARGLGAVDAEVNRYTAEALFSTITNVDFDARPADAMDCQRGNRPAEAAVHGAAGETGKMRPRRRTLRQGRPRRTA